MKPSAQPAFDHRFRPFRFAAIGRQAALTSLLTAFVCALLLPSGHGAETDQPGLEELTALRCGNLVYATNKTSVCFADNFLTKVEAETSLRVKPRLEKVNLGQDALFDYPFCVLSGEGSFRFTEKERENLRRYLAQGGFVLSSPGCSDKAFDKALRSEIAAIFPDQPLERIPMTHPIFSTVKKVSKLTTKGGSQTQIEGLTLNGRLVMVYSTEGLNNVKYAKGCCCCGGNEIRESGDVNLNIFTYALLY